MSVNLKGVSLFTIMKNNTMIFIFLTILTLYQKIIENRNKKAVKNFYNKKAVLYFMFTVILTCIFYKFKLKIVS